MVKDSTYILENYIFWVFTELALNAMLAKLPHHPNQEAASPPPPTMHGWQHLYVYHLEQSLSTFIFITNFKKRRKKPLGWKTCITAVPKQGMWNSVKAMLNFVKGLSSPPKHLTPPEGWSLPPFFPPPDSRQVHDRGRRGADEGGAEGGIQATQFSHSTFF